VAAIAQPRLSRIMRLADVTIAEERSS